VGDKLLFTKDTPYGHYQVVDTVYSGRRARVLYSGQRMAAQSGMAMDDDPELLFDYNQRLLELIIGLRPKKILLIGGGAYTLPIAVLKEVGGVHLTVIERDGALDDIAEAFFGLQPSDRLKIIHQDGREYLETCRQTYDLIIVDAFTHTIIPEVLREDRAIELMHKLVAPDGMVALNIIAAFYGRLSAPLRQQFQSYKKFFGQVEVFPASRSFSLWLPQNFVLVSQAGQPVELAEHLRFESLPSLY
jgi:spermidine synthase